MKLFKKKETLAIKSEKEIKRLDREFKRAMFLLGIEYKHRQYLWTSVYGYFTDDSPITILQEKFDLILEHLGLEYKSTEERTAGMKGKLYKKPKKKGKEEFGSVAYHKRGIKAETGEKK